MGSPGSRASDPGAPSSREREVIRLVATGWSNDEIAGRLALSRKTVEFHLSNLYRRYELPGRAALVMRAVAAKWI